MKIYFCEISFKKKRQTNNNIITKYTSITLSIPEILFLLKLNYTTRQIKI